MKEKKAMCKGFVLGILATLLVSTMVIPGLAATVAKTITVYTGITLYFDGVKVDPKDANGNSVEPLLYNGTTSMRKSTGTARPRACTSAKCPARSPICPICLLTNPAA